MNYLILPIITLLLFSGCARSPIKTPEKAMRLTTSPASLNDDLDLGIFKNALNANIEQLEKSITKSPLMIFGPRTIKKTEYILSLQSLVQSLDNDPSGTKLKELIQQNFEFFEIYGQKKWGEVFITSYFDPVIKGSLTKTERFSQPIYKLPPDMVTVDLDQYAKTFKSLAVLNKKVLEQKSRKSILRGRLLPSAKSSSQKIIPYYSRKEIDSEGMLSGQGLELAWVDPIESFFLQIQGSGVIELYDRDKKLNQQLKVGYHAQNGHPYVAIGKFLLDIIPLEKMSMQAIKKHLRSLSIEDSQKIMNKNPSYVFFRKLESKSIGFLGTEVVPGRTIATDYGLFPKGAIAYLEFNKPVFKNGNKDNTNIPEWIPTSRFVLDQDTGGAIRGPHRLDLYWGQGYQAARHAGIMKHWGKLFYLVPKISYVPTLKTQ